METVTVTADSPIVDTSTSGTQARFQAQSQPRPQSPKPQSQAPSQNVVNLQQRASGVLPIRVDVPRAGISHEFIKPLVVGTKSDGDAPIQAQLTATRVDEFV